MLDETSSRLWRYGPEDACRFARYCAGLDFWSINDHAEEILPRHWQENVDAVRACNDEFGGYKRDAEMVAYLGWEWTHSTNDPATDFGHHNVVLKDSYRGVDDDCLSTGEERAWSSPIYLLPDAER